MIMPIYLFFCRSESGDFRDGLQADRKQEAESNEYGCVTKTPPAGYGDPAGGVLNLSAVLFYAERSASGREESCTNILFN